jgi:hypothetical protein
MNLKHSTILVVALGLVQLCRALQVNATLTEWGIGCNPIGREGAEAVAAMLAKNKTLRALDFRATQMPEEELRKVMI